jgi:hypothetical protein
MSKALVSIAVIIVLPSLVFAQGSIFGQVTNSDVSLPAEGEISFFGYLDDTDEEIRIETSVGAGYDNGNWFDDFQNYLTEAPGNPYNHHFHNHANGEGFILSGPIPNNSFQQEDISLNAINWPETPTGLTADVLSYWSVEISWAPGDGSSWHIYRRMASSDGSLFRIDDPAGTLANPGVTDTFYVDSTLDSAGAYDYMIIAEDLTGNLSPHSEVITINIADSIYIPGDANADGLVNVGDCTYTINFIFREGPPPMPYISGDSNCDTIVNVGDVVYTINYIFREGPPPGCP